MKYDLSDHICYGILRSTGDGYISLMNLYSPPCSITCSGVSSKFSIKVYNQTHNTKQASPYFKF